LRPQRGGLGQTKNKSCQTSQKWCPAVLKKKRNFLGVEKRAILNLVKTGIKGRVFRDILRGGENRAIRRKEGCSRGAKKSWTKQKK